MKIGEIRRFVRKANYGRPIKVEESVKEFPEKDRKASSYEVVAACLFTPRRWNQGESSIILFSEFFRLGYRGQLFVLLHELGHLHYDMQELKSDEDLDEIAANCWARVRAREMRIRVRKPNHFCIPENGS